MTPELRFRQVHQVAGLDENGQPLAWNGRDTRSLSGQTVRVRFEWQDARLYPVHAFSTDAKQLSRGKTKSVNTTDMNTTSPPEAPLPGSRRNSVAPTTR